MKKQPMYVIKNSDNLYFDVAVTTFNWTDRLDYATKLTEEQVEIAKQFLLTFYPDDFVVSRVSLSFALRSFQYEQSNGEDSFVYYHGTYQDNVLQTKINWTSDIEHALTYSEKEADEMMKALRLVCKRDVSIVQV